MGKLSTSADGIIITCKLVDLIQDTSFKKNVDLYFELIYRHLGAGCGMRDAGW